MKQQYLDIYKQAHQLLNDNGASCINAIRAEAFQQFEAKGFPTQKEEDYLYCPTIKHLDTNYGLNLKQIAVGVDNKDLFRCSVSGINSYTVTMVNEQIREGADALPNGLIVCSLKEACQHYPDIIAKYFNQVAKAHEDAFTHFNNMLAQNGFFVYVTRNSRIEQPLQLVRAFFANVEMMICSRNLIVIEEGAEAKILVCDHNKSTKSIFHNAVNEIVVERGARLGYYELESTSENTIQHTQTFVAQQADSDVCIDQLTLSNGTTHHHTVCDLNEQHCNIWLGGMVLNDRKQQTENHTLINHKVANCTSCELFKYILDEEAQAAFSGLIVVKDGATKTEAYQTNRNLCLTPTARMFAKPQLEIYCDDVKCGHGATTGQLDERAIFYMQARGIGRDEAKMLLMLAFVVDVIDKIEVEALRDRLKMMVEKRLRGEGIKCSNCAINSK